MKSLSVKLFCLLLVVLLTTPAVAEIVVEPEDITWTTDAGIVTFQIRFHNPDPTAWADEVSCTLYAQDFGVFLPNQNEIGTYDVPPIPPDSFFDVFMEIPFDQLPPPPEVHHPWDPMKVQPYCTPDDHWDGNVDLIWAGPGGAGTIDSHLGTLLVCPTYGASEIHVVTNCVINMTYTITGVCAGFTVQLVNEDYTAAPSPLAANWSGYIRVTADATVPIGTVCCFTVNFTCGGSTIPLILCAEACDCGPISNEDLDWGRVKSLYK
ncbi:hypothetical protein KKG45_11880 [bacterium]|nr:hypothetical protein [bacterium]